MKLVFLCGSLEPGKDGVGDYTRKLAGEMIRQGNEVKMVALHDRHVIDKQTQDAHQYDSDTQIAVMRIASVINWNDKIVLVKKMVDAFNPHWVSLQYVPYSFHNKGLPFQIANGLSKMAPSYSWHLMFHELWIGISRISPLSHKLTGSLQKRIAKSIVHNLHPDLITTTNILYKSVLRKAGIDSVILPLFSNIPFVEADADFKSSIFNQLAIDKDEIGQWLFTGTFGTLYPEADLHSAIMDHYKLALEQNKKLAFIAFGRINDFGKNKMEELKQAFEGKVRFLYAGEQPEDKVSQLLQLLDYGISCTPAQHSGKSGVYAAMKLHGLPVTLSSYEYLPEYDAIIKEYQPIFESRAAQEWSVQFIATQFAHLLSSQAKNNQNRL